LQPVDDRVPQELNTVSREEHRDLMPLIKGGLCNEERERGPRGSLRPVGDVYEELSHQNI
jgi:hypothetical protein